MHRRLCKPYPDEENRLFISHFVPRKTGAARLPTRLGKDEVTGSNPVISSMNRLAICKSVFVIYKNVEG